uniref:hypothetical protein n=1 Tax=Nonomuraea sp. CA-251285 TaxID=3240002 RepID=UPI003F4972BF
MTLRRTRSVGYRMFLSILFKKARPAGQMGIRTIAGLGANDCQELGAVLQRRAKRIERGQRNLETELRWLTECTVPLVASVFTVASGGQLQARLTLVDDRPQAVNLVTRRWPLTGSDCQVLGLRLEQIGQALAADKQQEAQFS